MRDLDNSNPDIARPDRFIPLMAILPIISSVLGMVLAAGAAVDVPLMRNPIWVACFAILVVSSLFLLIPRLWRWGWRVQNFGIGMLLFGSLILWGAVPWACLLVYGSLLPLSRAGLFTAYVCVVVWWAWRYVPAYRRIFSDRLYRNELYREEQDACYYSQPCDKYLMEIEAVPRHFPANRYFILSTLLAFLGLLFSREIVGVVGTSPIHIFLGIAFPPMDMATAGMVCRGILIYFHYPSKISRETGKPVYMDMSR